MPTPAYAAFMGLEAAAETQSSTPETSRNPYLDLIRVQAIAAVVVGHWLATGITYSHGELQGVDVLSVVRWTSWLTLLLQVVPVFFLVGGYANALSWTRYQSAGGSAFAWTRRRALRLLIPTAAYVALVSFAVVLCDAAGANHGDLEQAAWALSLHLWFLAVYLVLLLLTPALFAAYRRYGIRGLAATTAIAVTIDIGVIEAHWHVVGWLNYLLVWGTFHQLGFAWHEGFFTGRRGRPFALTAGAIFALVALIWWGPYPVSMIGVPGARIQNASPPSAALLAFGLAQIGLVLLAAPWVTTWLTRPDRGRLRTGIGRANAMTMPIYLWHMVPLVVVAVVAYPNRLLAQPSIGSGAWWVQRIAWIAALTVVLVAVVALVVVAARLARAAGVQPTSAPVSVARPALPRLVSPAFFALGVMVTVAALGRLAVQGFAPNGSLDTTTIAGFAAGTLIAAVARPRAGEVVGQARRDQSARTRESAQADAPAPAVVVAGRLGPSEPGASAPPRGAG
jgi:surface polysaccharide O-acyltransferase-like enzyme